MHAGAVPHLPPVRCIYMASLVPYGPLTESSIHLYARRSELRWLPVLLRWILEAEPETSSCQRPLCHHHFHPAKMIDIPAQDAMRMACVPYLGYMEYHDLSRPAAGTHIVSVCVCVVRLL